MSYPGKVEVTVTVGLIESLINYDFKIGGSVVLQEIKIAMEKYLANGLMRGCSVTLKEAFEAAWVDLVLVSPTMEMSLETDYFDEN